MTIINSFKFASGGGGGGSAPTIGGSGKGEGANSFTTGSFTSSSGSTVIVGVNFYTDPGTVTVTDSKGNTYSAIGTRSSHI